MCRIEMPAKPELLYFSLPFSISAEHLVYYIGELLAQSGHVLPGWSEDVLQREVLYPTGLRLSGGNLAIPHPQGPFNAKEALVVVSLREPSYFYDMENPANALAINLVLFPIFVRDGQMVDFLARLLQHLSSAADAKKIFSSNDEGEIRQFFESVL